MYWYSSLNTHNCVKEGKPSFSAVFSSQILFVLRKTILTLESSLAILHSSNFHSQLCSLENTHVPRKECSICNPKNRHAELIVHPQEKGHTDFYKECSRRSSTNVIQSHLKRHVRIKIINSVMYSACQGPSRKQKTHGGGVLER